MTHDDLVRALALFYADLRAHGATQMGSCQVGGVSLLRSATPTRRWGAIRARARATWSSRIAEVPGGAELQLDGQVILARALAVE